MIFIDIEKYLELEEYYDKNPDEFIALMYPDIKLSIYQKMIIRLMRRFKGLSFSETIPKSRQKERTYIYNLKIEMGKILELDFAIASPSKIEIYEKGKLVSTKYR